MITRKITYFVEDTKIVMKHITKFEKAFKQAGKFFSYEVTEGLFNRQPVCHMTLKFESIVDDGWEFVAFIDHVDGLAHTDEKYSDFDLTEYRNRCVCDYCKKKRERKSTFIFMRNGEIMQVGTECARKFMGYENYIVMKILNDLFPIIAQMQESELDIDRVNTGNPYFTIEEACVMAYNSIMERGFKKTSENFSTAWHMSTCYEKLLATGCQTPVAGKFIHNLIDEYKDYEGTSNYKINLKILLEKRFINERHFGMIASMVWCGLAKQAEGERKKILVQVGDVLEDVSGEIKSIAPCDGYWGMTYRVSVDSEKYGKITGFTTSKKLLDNFTVGDRITVKKMTVKRCDDEYGVTVKFNKI